jgi:heat shock protein HslJ
MLANQSKLWKEVLPVVTLGVILLVACGSRAIDLDGTAWLLNSLNGDAPIAGSEITLSFEEAKLTGRSGCNLYSGDYAIEGEGTFQAGPFEVTEMACLDPMGVMDQEVDYLQILQGASTIGREDDELTIQGGGNTLVFWLVNE